MGSGEKLCCEHYQVHEANVNGVAMEEKARIIPAHVDAKQKIVVEFLPVEHKFTHENLEWRILWI